VADFRAAANPSGQDSGHNPDYIFASVGCCGGLYFLQVAVASDIRWRAASRAKGARLHAG